ncbi:hypothetical protein O7543_12160 [Solwaraspora sp. WMMA2080]|uniref:hypothetical protein n=1 Tax=unclassified Solwaraspora TaxID=2627926 RepID=UPI00248AED82|nr:MULTISPECIES: hypothetical protein [unclassified Solwaraspora]WBB98332.1 hypothetical protein O7553_05205 [Solwaraspora sp. WMMA2059]WBC23115.1 hypothetical protein O7543_12160 [Solwaraspora sp. WMMA2080]
MGQHSEDDLRAVIARYEATRSAALTSRDEQLRAFHAAGWRPVDLQRVTGYSRETIRQALRPEVRQASNRSRRKTAPQPPADYRPYGDRKPYVVADNLTALTGPTAGVVTLPRHMDWSGNAEYDLSRPARLASMYKVVLAEAATVDDLNTWINADLLRRLWPTLWLPPQLRRLWEETFPELVATGTNAA